MRLWRTNNTVWHKKTPPAILHNFLQVMVKNFKIVNLQIQHIFLLIYSILKTNFFITLIIPKKKLHDKNIFQKSYNFFFQFLYVIDSE